MLIQPHPSPTPGERVDPEYVAQLWKANKKNFHQFYEREVDPIIQEIKQLRLEVNGHVLEREGHVLEREGHVLEREGLRQKLQELKKSETVIDSEIQELDRDIAERNEQLKELAQQKEENQKALAESRARQTAALQGLQEVAKERRDVLTKQFYTIFNKTPIPTEEIEALFQKYLSDGCSFTVEKTHEGRSYSQINSMKPVIQYLDDHPNVKACDFRVFKTAVQDIPTLVEYLKKSKIIAIALKSGISEEAKASLAYAVAARKGLNVKYFD